ncbi:MAG: class E sortase, partial [Actinomycetota bacterium]
NGPGHWPGTPIPGNAGNSVFAGHRTTFTAPFADLDLLRPGDPVTTRVGRNPPITYRVSRTTVVPESEYVDFVLKQPKKRRARILTLFACTPKGQRTHRIVVSAHAQSAPEK